MAACAFLERLWCRPVKLSPDMLLCALKVAAGQLAGPHRCREPTRAPGAQRQAPTLEHPD